MRRVLMLSVILAAGLTLGGCLGLIGSLSPTNTGNISETISFNAPLPDDLLKSGIEAAQSMGYRLTSRSLARKTALLEYDGRRKNPLFFFIGKVKKHRVQLTAVDAQSIAIEIHTTGNLGGGDYEDALKILEEFKQRMMAYAQ